MRSLKLLFFILLACVFASAQIQVVYTRSGLAQATTPSFTPASPYTGPATNVVISSPDPGVSLFYCTDGTNTCSPTTPYTTAVSVPSTGFVRAQGKLLGVADSAIGSWSGTITAACSNPTVTQIGADGSGLFGANFTFTSPAIAANKLVVVELSAGFNGSINAGESITDARGNTYNFHVENGSSISAAVAFYSSRLTTPLQNGDLITVNNGSGTSIIGQAYLVDCQVPSTYVDQTGAANTFFSTNRSVSTSGTLTGDTEIVFAAHSTVSSVSAWTGFTQLSLRSDFTGTATGYKVISSGGLGTTQTSTLTADAASDAANAIVTFKLQ